MQTLCVYTHFDFYHLKAEDEESGIVFELIPKTEEATQGLVEKFLDSFQVLKVNIPKVEPFREKEKPLKKPTYERPKTREKRHTESIGEAPAPRLQK